MICNALVWSVDAIRWPETISALAAMFTAGVAIFAITTWKSQDKAKRRADFIDELVDAMHTYIAAMSSPIALLQMAKIGMTSHAPTWEMGEPTNTAMKGTIAYIQSSGEHDGRQLRAALKDTKPSVIKLRSLVVKGQVFAFDDYQKCSKSVAMLTWHFDRIEAFTAIIGWSTWNWENQEVQASLKSQMTIDAEDIRKSVVENNLVLLEFAREEYTRLYS